MKDLDGKDFLALIGTLTRKAFAGYDRMDDWEMYNVCIDSTGVASTDEACVNEWFVRVPRACSQRRGVSPVREAGYAVFPASSDLRRRVKW